MVSNIKKVTKKAKSEGINIFRKKARSRTLWIGGTSSVIGVLAMIFLLSGVSYTYSGDTWADQNGTAYAYVNITSSYWRICFAEDFKPITIDPYGAEYKLQRSYYSGWKDFDYTKDCIERGKINKLRLVFYNVTEKTKWSFSFDTPYTNNVNIDPYIFTKNDLVVLDSNTPTCINCHTTYGLTNPTNETICDNITVDYINKENLLSNKFEYYGNYLINASTPIYENVTNEENISYIDNSTNENITKTINVTKKVIIGYNESMINSSGWLNVAGEVCVKPHKQKLLRVSGEIKLGSAVGFYICLNNMGYCYQEI